ncbi:MAG: ISAzo13 family transposase, partial [Proteobacteria bacterium]|nr:ISAzo13 family transposase [Pseudomonadota bacterium]
MKYETAGDPVGDLKWTRRTTRKIAKVLGKIGIHVSKNTVGRLLKSIDFRLRVNHKKRSTTSPKERDAQFRYIKKMRETLVKRGDPVISIDCKKKELVGDFKNDGTAWRESAIDVLDHDFPSNAKGTAAPFGFYD